MKQLVEISSQVRSLVFFIPFKQLQALSLGKSCAHLGNSLLYGSDRLTLKTAAFVWNHTELWLHNKIERSMGGMLLDVSPQIERHVGLAKHPSLKLALATLKVGTILGHTSGMRKWKPKINNTGMCFIYRVKLGLLLSEVFRNS